MAHTSITQGTFVVIIGPSAVGKTAVVDALLEKIPESKRITTLTTRLPREGENEGDDFFFVSRIQFEKLRDADILIEWSEHFSNYYGTSKEYLDELLEQHPVIFAVLDINGARQVCVHMPEALTLFLKPGDMSDLERRLKERKNESPKRLQERFERAAIEIQMAPSFKHTVTNIDGKFEETVVKTHDIIMSEVQLTA